MTVSSCELVVSAFLEEIDSVIQQCNLEYSAMWMHGTEIEPNNYTDSFNFWNLPGIKLNLAYKPNAIQALRRKNAPRDMLFEVYEK